MSELDLRLPGQIPNDRPKNKASEPLLWRAVVLILLLTCCIGIWLPCIKKCHVQPVGAAATPMAAAGTVEVSEEMIVNLKKAGAFKEAAELLSLWLQNPALTTDRKARLLSKQGELYDLAGLHGEALKSYYLSAESNLGRDADLERETSAAIIEVLRKMGQFSAVSSYISEKNRSRQGGKPGENDPVVAKFDGKPFLMSDLDVELKKFVDARVAELARDSKEASEVQRIEADTRKQYAAPYEKMKFLETWLQGEILYQEAVAFKMEQHPRYEEAMQSYRKNLLSNLLLQSKVQAAPGSELDLKNYATAHKEQLGLSTDPGQIKEEQFNRVKDKAEQLYREEKSRENMQIFQAEVMKRHEVEIMRDAFSQGAH